MTKAVVITSNWAMTFSALFCALVGGGVSFAWNTHAEVEVLKTSTGTLQTDVDTLKNAHLPEGVTDIKTNTINLNNNLTDIKLDQRELASKVDWLIEHTPTADN